MPDDAGGHAVPPEVKDYWNARARRSGGDAVRAACLDEPLANACIDAVQRRVLGEALARLARRRELDGSAVLDLGCGSGRWIGALGAAGCRYVGVDVAGEMLELASADHPGTCLVLAEGQALPFAGARFDLIWSVAAVHHSPHDAQPRIVEEMARVLKSDGAILLFEGLGGRAAGGEVYWPRPLDEWLEIGRRAGLRCVWRRGARYLIAASAIEKIVGRSSLGGLSRVAARLDVWLDPYLLPLLPARYWSRAAMILRKE
jgi:SAM-dependent methyltransferase